MALPQPGKIFENYKVLKLIGQGGMGHVYLAEDIKLSRKVALKFLVSGETKMDPKILQRFENEAKILASLNHPNIVNIYNFGTYEGINFLGMEYVPGLTLSTIIEKKSFGVTESIEAIKQILSGLAEAHNKGILHRDIKPANLLVSDDNKIKIVDFGISKNLTEDDMKLTQENHFIGTINYMAPELLKGHNPTPASDLFSVGVVFFELLTGKNPFPTENKFKTIDAIRYKQVQIPKSIYDVAPANTIAVVKKLLARERDDRFQSAQEALTALENVTDVLPDFTGVSMAPDDTTRLSTIDDTTKLASIDTPTRLVTPNDPTRLVTKNDLTKLAPITPAKKIRKKRPAKKVKIPFPLFKPTKLLIRLSIIFAIVSVNYWGYKKFFLNGKIQPKEIVSKITNFLPKASEINLERSPSSITAGQLKPWQIGVLYEFKTRKVNTNTGFVVFNHTNTIRVKKIENNIMYAYLKNGGNGKWSSQHLSINAFEPAKRWFRKRGFNLKTIVVGDSNSIYPVKPGKKTSFFYNTLSKNGSIYQTEKKCLVKEPKEITVANKKIQTYEVECSLKSDFRTEKTTLYYSPKLNMVIKSQSLIKGKKGQFKESFELSKIK